MNLEEKIDNVKSILKDRKVAVGFSGGADSTLIAYLSSEVAKDTLAITINNHMFPKGFIEDTRKATESLGIQHEIVDINFYDDERFLSNDSRRCYTCRELMYGEIKRIARERGFDFVCDGNNISDLVIDRPGILITYREGFETPLIEARLTSKEIHEYLKGRGIPYSRSTTCLATRIPTGTPATSEKINRIRHLEDIIMSCGNCEIVKLRDRGKTALIEVDNPEELMNGSTYDRIRDEILNRGFENVVLNRKGLDDDETVEIDYENGSFSYELPFEINLENTSKQIKDRIINENEEKIELENMTINQNGMINGSDYDNYEDALNDFMDILTKLRRDMGE